VHGLADHEAEPMDEVSPREGGRGLGAVRSSKNLGIDPTYPTRTLAGTMQNTDPKELDLSKLHSFAKGHFGVSTAQHRIAGDSISEGC